MIALATNKGGASFTIVGGADDSSPIVIRMLGYGYSEGFFSRLGREKHGVKGGTGTKGGFDINTIIGIISGFKIRGFES
jgi:hypothetical protein